MNLKNAEGSCEAMEAMTYASPLGLLTLAARGDALVGLWLAGQKYFPETAFSPGPTPVLLKSAQWLDRYFAGARPAPQELPLAPLGSPFRREVWELLCHIPWGETTTYGAIAREIAARRGLAHMSAQAVGSAVGHNPISIIIPCHRVLGTDGSLTGYAGGLERKKWLLAWEGAAVGAE